MLTNEGYAQMKQSNSLEQLKLHTRVVADTGNFMELPRFAPQDATTNPSLILKAVRLRDYAPLVLDAVDECTGQPMEDIVDDVLVRFGVEILKIVPGRISTEVDARLSHDTSATVARAKRIVSRYRSVGIDRERVLIKIAATWEGIQAARILESEGIHCNLTLLFSFCQAVFAADAGAQLISPFVGRVYDWCRRDLGAKWDETAYAGANDPGVRLVTCIYDHFKRFGITTEVMGASFRNIAQVRALAGCDLLTISPGLLAELENSTEAIVCALQPPASEQRGQNSHFDEGDFRRSLANDRMASENLEAGIRAFAADTCALERMIGALQ